MTDGTASKEVRQGTGAGEQPGGRHRRWIFLAPVVGFAAVAVVLGLGLLRDPSLLPSALVGKPAPEFDLAAVPGHGPGFSNAKLGGGEVALVNVFASWCASCRIEHPLLMSLAREGEVPVYGIEWGVYGVPETYVVDGGGRVAYRHVGPITAEDWRETIAPLIAELGR